MKRSIGLAMLAAVVFPAAVWCAEATPSHRQAAQELLDVAGASRSIEAGASAMIEAQIHANPALEPYRDVLLEWVRKYITWEAMAPKVIDLYTQSFTEAELREITTFYKTPTGQKALQQMPALMQQGAMMGVDLAKQHQAELEAMIKARKAELDKQEKPKKDGGI